MRKVINSKKVSLKKLMMMASIALAAFGASSKVNTITALATDIPTDGEPWDPKNEFEENKKELETPPSPSLDPSDNPDPYKEVLFDDDTESYDVEPIDDKDVLGNEVTTSEEETVTSVANDGASTGVSIDEYPPLPPITHDTDLDKFIPKEDLYPKPDPDMDLDKETVKTVHEESKPKSSSKDTSSDSDLFPLYLYLLGIYGLKKLNEKEKRESEEDEEELEETVEEVQETANDNLDEEENEIKTDYEPSYQTEEEQKHKFSFFR